MKGLFWLLVFLCALGAVAYFGFQHLQNGGCIKNAYGQCTTGEFSP